MRTRVKSTDHRMPAIRAALKVASTGTKVTDVLQVGPTTFEGHCMRPHPDQPVAGRIFYESLGRVQVSIAPPRKALRF